MRIDKEIQMELFPAIDIINKNVVRLFKGDYDRMTIYSDSPLETAIGFEKCGAANLHVVDLDGAKNGTTENFDVIRDIAENTGLFIEVGGGIRNEERIKRYIDCGVGRVILGSVAVENPDFVSEMTEKYGEKIAVGVDAKDGFVAIHGWKTISPVDSVEFCRDMQKRGVKTVIYTDISKDGAMSGTNLDIYRLLCGIEGLDIVASGGITYYSELEELRALGIYGAILGKALYTGAIDLKRAIEENKR